MQKAANKKAKLKNKTKNKQEMVKDKKCQK